MKNVFKILIVLCLAFAATAAVAQDVTTGSIGGTVVDANGGALPGAKVTATGPTGEKSTVTNDQGGFQIDGLIPGSYNVKIEQTGFKSAVANNVQVFVTKRSTLNLKLETGDISAVVEVTDTAGTD